MKKILIVLSVLVLSGCAATEEKTSVNHLTVPEIPEPTLDINTDIRFSSPKDQTSGICFSDVESSENYLKTLSGTTEYILKQKEVIKYYKNSIIQNSSE
jgi:uncharacterized lipoprotein YajG